MLMGYRVEIIFRHVLPWWCLPRNINLSMGLSMNLLRRFAFIFLVITVHGQNSIVNPVSDLEQLSGVQVNDIEQDSIGFLWIGTNEGLYRYDGYNLKLYEPHPKIVGSSIITTIFFARNGDLFVGTRGGLLSYNRTRDVFVNFEHDRSNRTSINGNSINSIAEDSNGRIWIALSKRGVDLFDRQTKNFQHFLTADGTGLLSDDISDLFIDKNNQLWISTWDDGINTLNLGAADYIDPAQVRFDQLTAKHNLPKRVVIPFIFNNPATDDLYVATATTGLFKYDKSTNSFVSLGIKALEKCSFYDASFTSDGKTWVATDFGIRLVDLETKSLDNCPDKICGFSGPVYSVFIDKQNITWLGTHKGIAKHVEKKITHHRINERRNANNTMAFAKQGKYLWVATWREGLYLLDENNNAIRVNADNNILMHIWDIKLINNKWLFVATTQGVVRLEVGQPSFTEKFKETNFPSDVTFTSFSKNATGPTWVGTWKGGLYRIDPEDGELLKFEKYSTEEHFVQAVYHDHTRDQLWVGTVHSGLIRLSDVSSPNVKATRYAQQMTPASGLSSDFVSVLFEDHEQKLWIGTGDGGVNIFDLKTEKISWILKGEKNLPSNTIRAITQDDKNVIWISSKSGISKFDDQKIFINYTEDDGLEYLEFNPNAVLKTNTLLYFGNGQGFNVFSPSDLSLQTDPPRIYITDVKIFDRSISPGELYEGKVILERPVNELETINLSYKVKNISFDVSALNLINPKREIFAYTLEGFNDNWVYTNAANRYLSFSNLEPGDYTLKIKTARNTDVGGVQGRVLKIHIIPPIWKRTWFIVAVGCALVGLLYVWHWMRLAGLRRQKILFEKLAQERVGVIESKNKLLEQQNIEIQKQAAQLHEADQSKINFFANISHEFRTPLMLIVGPIAKLMEGKGTTDNETLQIVHRNSKRLLRLVDQIMDFSKLEAGSLTLNAEKGDFVHFVKEIIDSFNYLVTIKHIDLTFHSTENELAFYFDHDKLEKIIYNLLSNACKVTPTDGKITVTVNLVNGDGPDDFSHAQLEIFNSGRGIPQEELPKLFTRFYRTKSYFDGTGIGLSLTKSLVELQGGTIGVRSEEDKGSWFTVTLPIRATAPSPASVKEMRSLETSQEASSNVSEETESDKTSPGETKHAYSILILDDDDDMRLFMLKLLSPFYNVLESSNGEDALKMAHKLQPDLIVSDMMMPGMDGYQFLREVKQNPYISHIPIILLTARASLDARLKGLEEGADDYITKPFHEKILLLRVKNLIERMQTAKKRFSTDIDLEPKEMTITSLDEKFMQNLLNVVQQNISNTNFNADVICQELGVGRSYLYAKVKALTDLPVNEFVKTIRLKRAAILLAKGQLHVNEVAYNVGFNDRYYFSKCFLKQFGVSPSQYQVEHSNRTQHTTPN